MAVPNFLEGLFVIWKNGEYISPAPISNNPNFSDIPAGQIIYVRKYNYPDINGTDIPCYFMVVQNPKSLQPDYYYIQVKNFIPSLNALQVYLNALGLTLGNSFSLYSALLQAPVPFDCIADYNGAILINDSFVRPRKYDPGDNVTYIPLNVIQNVEYLTILVGGDQSIGGSYYYGYYHL